MIGYGFLNSEVQKFAVKGIITSFLERSLVFVYPIYLYKSGDSLPEKIINIMYDLFIQEEILLSSENGESQENILKYILSANVCKNKDYDFVNINNEQILEDGKKNLKEIFVETINLFFKDKIIEGIKIQFENFYKSINSLLIGPGADPDGDGFGLQTADVGQPSTFAKALQNEILGITDEPVSGVTFDDISTYLRRLKNITEFYKNNNFLNSRNIYINILNEQINSLNQGEKI